MRTNTFEGRTDAEIADILRANVRALEELIHDAELLGLWVDLDFQQKDDLPGPAAVAAGDNVDDIPDFYGEFSTLYLEVYRCL